MIYARVSVGALAVSISRFMFIYLPSDTRSPRAAGIVPKRCVLATCSIRRFVKELRDDSRFCWLSFRFFKSKTSSRVSLSRLSNGKVPVISVLPNRSSVSFASPDRFGNAPVRKRLRDTSILLNLVPFTCSILGIVPSRLFCPTRNSSVYNSIRNTG